MKNNDYAKKLEEIVNYSIYQNAELTMEYKKDLKDINRYLQSSPDFIETLRSLLVGKSNENYLAYEVYVKDFLKKANKDVKKNLLNEQYKYEDLLRSDELYYEMWDSLKIDERIDYLVDKRKYTDIDIKLINHELKDNSTFQDNVILTEIMNNKEIHKKIDPFSITIPYSYSLLSIINLNDFDMCNILSKDTYTQILIKKYRAFKEFRTLYEENNKIFNLISNNSLVFDKEDNEEIYNFILENPNFMGKFQLKYLDLFSLVEITKMSKLKTLDGDAYSAIIQKLYNFDGKANEYFSLESLPKCPKHSILVYPFDDMDEELKQKIFSTYTLFNKFIDTIMIEAINKQFQEEDIVSLLRNDTFIEDMSPYAIELLINKLSFKATFNMLQRKIIFDKINYLNVNITDKDAIFVRGFLDSPILLSKSSHTMIYEMLRLLPEKEIMNYLCLPYVTKELSNIDIVNLGDEKNIGVLEFIKYPAIRNKLNVNDFVNYINLCFKKKVDLQIFKNRELGTLLLQMSDKEWEKTNFDEINYLFETIRTKSVLSQQESPITFYTYKYVYVAYQVLGLQDTLKLIINGNKGIDLNEVKKLQKDIIDEKLLLFKENNAAIFQNMPKKVINNLEELQVKSLDDLIKAIKRDTYLDNIVYLMLQNNYDSFNEIMKRFYSYVEYHKENEYECKKEIFAYVNNFVDSYLGNIKEKYTHDFDKILLTNFKPKEKIIYNKRKQVGKEFLEKLKFKIFVRALTDENKEYYNNFFSKEIDLGEIQNIYKNFLTDQEVDFQNILEHVLIPYANERFEFENCLTKLGIKKPQNTDVYFKYLEDIRFITRLNHGLKKYKEKYNTDKIIKIMNGICYGNEIDFELSKKERNEIISWTEKATKLNGEIYVDKSILKFLFKTNLDIYNTEDIISYKKYLEILQNIINKTKYFINKYMNKEYILNVYSNDYIKAINEQEYTFPITSKYYEPIKRVFSLKDIENIFAGYDINKCQKLNQRQRDFLLQQKNLVMVAEGYYEGVVDNLGVILSSWDEIEKYLNNCELKLEEVSLLRMENIINIIQYKNNIIGKSINKDVVKSIWNDGCYEIEDINIRMHNLLKLYQDGLKRIKSTIPYLTCTIDDYKIEIGDNYNQDILRSLDNSVYKVGGIGNDFLHYSILDKNGLQILIYYKDILKSKVLGIRNGNTIFLNTLEGEYNDKYTEILSHFARELIDVTKNEREPIQFVTMVNNDKYCNTNGCIIDVTTCPMINYPINTSTYDYEEFIKNDNLIKIDDKMYTNYNDNVSTLLASSMIVDKKNFKIYDADSCYLRKRNHVMKLSNNVNEENLNKIDTILYLCKYEDKNVSIENLNLSDMDTIYLGDDFVLFVTEGNHILEYVLPYDERAWKEVSLIKESL